MTVSATIVLRGRGVVGGRAEGEALVTRDAIPGWGGVNPQQGVITETHHELRGKSFKDKVLVFRGAKGSSGWSAMYHTARLAGAAAGAGEGLQQVIGVNDSEHRQRHDAEHSDGEEHRHSQQPGHDDSR